MPRVRKDGGVTLGHLKANYHPDAIEYMLKKHNGVVSMAQAKEADQEWAANRAQEFARGQGRVNEQTAESLMQEPPLGAAIPMKRSREFDYAVENVGLKRMADSESQTESDVKNDIPKNNFETRLATP
jgi:hypothetical protein